jgi:hypothetical protein
MGHVVMFLDMVHVDGFSQAWNLVDPAGPLQNVGVILFNAFDVAFEVAKVDRIKAGVRGEKLNVRLHVKGTRVCVRLTE